MGVFFWVITRSVLPKLLPWVGYPPLSSTLSTLFSPKDNKTIMFTFLSIVLKCTPLRICLLAQRYGTKTETNYPKYHLVVNHGLPHVRKEVHRPNISETCLVSKTRKQQPKTKSKKKRKRNFTQV